VRMGLGGWKRTPPHRAAGYGLIAIGLVIMLFAMPLFVYAAAIGGFVAFVGYTLRGRK